MKLLSRMTRGDACCTKSRSDTLLHLCQHPFCLSCHHTRLTTFTTAAPLSLRRKRPRWTHIIISFNTSPTMTHISHSTHSCGSMRMAICQHTYGLSNNSSSCLAMMSQDTPCVQVEQLHLCLLVSPMTTSRRVAAGYLMPIAYTSGSIPSCYRHSCTASQLLTTTTNSTLKPVHISHTTKPSQKLPSHMLYGPFFS